MTRLGAAGRFGRMLASFALLLGAASSMRAQGLGQFERWADDRAPRRAPKGACADLRALTSYTLSIDAATLVPARGDAPEFCLVQGMIAPEVRFELSLPSGWNGRLYMFGNGGYAGEPLAAPSRVLRRDAALRRGFAVVSTNTGHDAAREPLGSFALSPQKLADYAYRAVHVTVTTAKDLARTYYGVAPARSYFDGCSTGGRQGLVSAQRFPDDFDGIVVGAPVLDITGTMLHYAAFNQALAAAPRLSEKVGLIAARSYEACDAADGLADSIIDDPRRCRFNPAADLPRCAANGDGDAAASCLTAAEAAALARIHGGVVVNGATVVPGYPVGGEAAVPAGGGGARSGWDPWIYTRDGRPSLSLQFVESFFKYMVTPGTEIDWRTVDPARDAEKLRTVGAMLNATDPDLRRFRARGGKILMYYGWADPALNPLMGVGYYERVRETMGPATGDFFRLFMMPGVFHCAGGVGPDAADTMTPLVQWVERGAAPDRIVATRRRGDAVVRTRPLCPYPQVARPRGGGAGPDDAAGFACVTP